MRDSAPRAILLSLVIVGCSHHQEATKSQVVSSKPESAGRSVIGRWIDEALPSQIEIYSEGGKLFIERAFTGGGSNQLELVEQKSEYGRRFNKIDKLATSGDHYIIDADGNLRVQDYDGLITVAKKVL